MTTTQAPVPLAPEEEISRRLHLGRWTVDGVVARSASMPVAAATASDRTSYYQAAIQQWFYATGLSPAADATPAPPAPARSPDRDVSEPHFCTIDPTTLKVAVSLCETEKKFVSELMTYVMFYHRLSPSKSFSIGPGVSVSVFGAIAWILLLFSSVFEDKTLILQHLYREFKHRLATATRAQAAVRDKPVWSLEEGLMYHATLLIELMKGPAAIAAIPKFKPQPLKVLSAEFNLERFPPYLIQKRDDAYNIYTIIANDMETVRVWMNNDPILDVMRHFYHSRMSASAKEKGYYKDFMRASYAILIKGASKLLKVEVGSIYADALALSPEPVPEITTMPEYKIAHFISKIIVSNRMAEWAAAARV